jgi:tetraacyldisaccharide 4'-kinase
MDDGYQHWRLKRDMDIVTIDATNPWGNGCLLPRGILREPKRALTRADVFVLTRTDQGQGQVQQIKDDLRKYNPQAPIVETIHRPVCFRDIRSGKAFDLHSVRGKGVCAVSSIAAPEAFIRTLTGLGAEIKERFDFRDHHRYSPEDLRQVVQRCHAAGLTVIVTTEKDAVKIKQWTREIPETVRVLSLTIKINIIHGEDRLIERIHFLF